MDALRRVVVRSGYDFDYFITWELEARDVVGGACHEVAVEYTEYRFVCNNQQVVLFALEFEDDWLEADCEVVIRL